MSGRTWFHLGSKLTDDVAPIPGANVTAIFEIDLPSDLARFRLPSAVAARLQTLLDLQDGGQALTPEERGEAEGLVELAELLTLLRLRAERATQ